MTTWAGHTTRASRGQRSILCPNCGTPHFKTLAKRVIDWLDAHRDESLTYEQIVEQFDTTISSARHSMSDAVWRKRVYRRRSPLPGRRGLIVQFFSKRWAQPLNGRMVSGLHVESNLTVLLAFDNLSKGAKFHE